jgi:hypothetical protein
MDDALPEPACDAVTNPPSPVSALSSSRTLRTHLPDSDANSSVVTALPRGKTTA